MKACYCDRMQKQPLAFVTLGWLTTTPESSGIARRLRGRSRTTGCLVTNCALWMRYQLFRMDA